MKHVLAWVLLATMVLLSACGTQSAAQPTAVTAATTSAPTEAAATAAQPTAAAEQPTAAPAGEPQVLRLATTTSTDDSGLLAVGGDLHPERLLSAYARGIFPWYSEGQPILRHSPDPRFCLTPDALHETGVREVARIHAEMLAIARSVGFRGDLQAYFDHCRTDPRFFYADSDAGRAQYIADAERLLDEIRARQGELFSALPKSAVEVRPVEKWREKSAAKAFYSNPPEDRSRPGIFYINLYDVKAQPKWQLPVTLYHEAIPGHHVETCIAHEMQGLPRFRRFASIAAFSEGWGLYSERLPKEIGLYQDPYDDFGRLSLELMRACRLVVDTGIHAKKWSREKATDYMVETVGFARPRSQREVERYCTQPGQAWVFVAIYAALMGALIGGLTVGFADHWSSEKLVPSWAAVGALLGALAGTVAGLLYRVIAPLIAAGSAGAESRGAGSCRRTGRRRHADSGLWFVG